MEKIGVTDSVRNGEIALKATDLTNVRKMKRKNDIHFTT
jgi:hypothetical protein